MTQDKGVYPWPDRVTEHKISLSFAPCQLGTTCQQSPRSQINNVSLQTHCAQLLHIANSHISNIWRRCGI